MSNGLPASTEEIAADQEAKRKELQDLKDRANTKPIIIIPYGHQKSNKYWKEAFPNCQVIRAELMLTKEK